MRVPDTASIVLLGVEIEAPPFAHLSDADVELLITKCRRAIKSHRRDSLSKDQETAETALVAIEDLKSVLRDLMTVAPFDRQAAIQDIIDRG